jgi:hypothetical protein
MSYYIRALRDLPLEVWKIDDEEALRLGITNARGGAGTYFKRAEGETIWDTIRRQATGWFEPAGTNPFHQNDFQPANSTHAWRVQRMMITTSLSVATPARRAIHISLPWRAVSLRR